MIGSIIRSVVISFMLCLVLGLFVVKNYDAEEYCRAKRAEHEVIVCNSLRMLHFFYDRVFETTDILKKNSVIIFHDVKKASDVYFEIAQKKGQEYYDYLIKKANNTFPTDVVYTIQVGFKRIWRAFQQFSLFVVKTTINISLEIFHFLENYVFIGHFTFENIKESLTLISQMIARWSLKASEVIAEYIAKYYS